MLQQPAVQALLIQLVTLPLTLLVVKGVMAFIDWHAAVVVVIGAVLQGAIAASLARWRRLAPWWLWIQLLFPIALLATLALQIPSWIFLAAFLLLLGVYWTIFQTQVPFYPSGAATWQGVAGLLPPDRPVRVVDVGSGLGGLVLYLAAVRPDNEVTGIELAPLPWLVSVLRRRIASSRAEFLRGDYGALDFGQYDVVFAYLSPAAMPALWDQARAQMQPGSLLLSCEFVVDGVVPDMCVRPGDGGPVLYGWRF
ncbi:SAM-dependent methyltransferase [Undibacterium arcticum]|uniref:SAM-dependent methyltransferase n=1 Tax=Undibacterium arcticum TaxID=1762892 RepID=A0ABV7F616_9BURK